MQFDFHGLSALFAQLGLEHDPFAMQAFITRHSPLPDTVRLDEAEFWTPAQARMLRESLMEDADWAEVVDHLDAALRHPTRPAGSTGA